MLLIDRLRPLARDELRCEILGEASLNLKVLVNLQGAEAATACIAAAPHGLWNGVIEVAGGATSSQERSFKIRQPDRAHDVGKDAATRGRHIAFGHHEWHTLRHAIV